MLRQVVLFHLVNPCVNVIMANVVLMTLTVAGTTIEAILSTGDRYLSVDRFLSNCNVTRYGRKTYRCVAEIKMKAHYEDGCGQSKGARSRGIGSRERAISPRLYAPGS